MIKAKSEYGFNGLPLALRALSEAMQWLRAKGLLAQTPYQSSPRAASVKRLGLTAMNSGLGAVRAAERLQVDLHPLAKPAPAHAGSASMVCGELRPP
jgi:hypothetical protein